MCISDIIVSGCAEMGVDLPEHSAQQFETYYSFLTECNAVMDLTAVKGAEDTARLHFLDSLSVACAVELNGLRVIDIGSGAGFPGLALKLANPSIALTLLDAREKRVGFLSDLCKKLALAEVDCVHARAEEAALLPNLREGYDIAISRAVASLRILCELCLPFVCVRGRFIAMKSIDVDEEIDEAQTAITTLGGRITEVSDYRIPGTEITHRLIIIEKKEQTPPEYPRRFAKIQKRPL